MVMKNYPPEFKADAVALYEARPEAMIRSVTADLGINPDDAAELGPGGRREPSPGTADTGTGPGADSAGVSPGRRAGEPLSSSWPTISAATA